MITNNLLTVLKHSLDTFLYATYSQANETDRRENAVNLIVITV